MQRRIAPRRIMHGNWTSARNDRPLFFRLAIENVVPYSKSLLGEYPPSLALATIHAQDEKDKPINNDKTVPRPNHFDIMSVL